MSKVYEYYMEMEELCNEADYLAHMAEEEQLAQSEAYGVEHCGTCAKKFVTCNPTEDFCQGFNNMEDNKAQEFARKVAMA